MVEGPSTGQLFELNRPVTNLGRHTACQIRVESAEVAAQHAQILNQDGRWLIRDVAGSGGSYVNGEPVSDTRDLHAGDEIQVGPARFRFET